MCPQTCIELVQPTIYVAHFLYIYLAAFKGSLRDAPNDQTKLL